MRQILGWVCVFLVATTSWPMAVRAQDAARMDQVVQEYVDAKQFMGSVLVARGDQVLFNKGYGHANLEWQIANTPTTKFRLRCRNTCRMHRRHGMRSHCNIC